ncbi:bifunctional diaminohydroxyphosphoribosylaminopyrimidine deaminase/5-amino-6-(5-phosphoribosylamino)uracil reductase RibD [Verminephrobacter eiseniae]|uniref:bifunctional diaminohydroxyphosphoribosylaminopyrimidine deaminase/5-amino-6-(5-phosphoribosylamino)uracil reductase RibD n=1 Tax=Verminephrobacter eiseniae TaxID=364317 RepID=UPI002238DACC|nr:bifunctional diaminohydroxyphosphoribosylaminopyrimidine deaminase/5-amino-6-(5-phosphoribosylamino)uracil reductase RibD [Verminephrobacter eiseniae]MCW5238452.1 bifunctional diaminohydroxyphosphoribosylaminopyrimidine deaminase/5-amino-6-(5-phosphoribosylamino)uracil reductase RibD [Verminephrobacter eiseniae]
MSDIITAAITEALDLARQGLYRTSPNPRVGCVIADAAGVVIGRGSTGPAGGAHAEIMALRNAAAGGHSVRGATAYVTLEPCSHHGRTGPCCDALVAAGIAKVVASLTDPNPLVAGQGFARLRAAGVAVQVGPGAQAARELNVGFFSRMLRHRPWVRMKLAASLDGVTALADGSSQWITGPAARADGHAWRARACALLTGIGTVLADDPRLDVRALHTERQPALVLLDSALRVPLDAAIFAADRAVHIYAAAENDAKRRALEQRGATLAVLPDSRGRVDLAAMLLDLARRQVNELHVEAGHQINGALLRQGLVDELLVYLAPKLIGQGLGMAQLEPLAALSQAQALDFHGLERVGEDVRILARWRGREPFWG